MDSNVVGLWAQTAPGNLARQIVPVGRIFCPHLFLFQLVWPNQSIEALEGRHLASGKQRVAPWGILRLIWGPESNPLMTFCHLEAGLVSIYTYLTFWSRNGVHLHIFQFWGPEWCPFTHISNLGAGNGVHLHIFQIWTQVWVK